MIIHRRTCSVRHPLRAALLLGGVALFSSIPGAAQDAAPEAIARFHECQRSYGEGPSEQGARELMEATLALRATDDAQVMACYLQAMAMKVDAFVGRRVPLPGTAFVEALGRPSLAPELARLADSCDPAIQIQALRLFGSWRAEVGVGFARACSTSTIGPLAISAIDALVAIASEDARAALSAALGSEREVIVRSASPVSVRWERLPKRMAYLWREVHPLFILLRSDAVDVPRGGMSSIAEQTESVRVAIAAHALEALATLGHDVPEAELVRLSNSESLRVSHAALRALARRAPNHPALAEARPKESPYSHGLRTELRAVGGDMEAQAELVRLAESADFVYRAWALLALGELGTPEATRAIEAQPADAPPLMRQLALRSMAVRGDIRDPRPLATALVSHDPWIAREAGYVRGRLAPAHRAAVALALLDATGDPVNPGAHVLDDPVTEGGVAEPAFQTGQRLMALPECEGVDSASYSTTVRAQFHALVVGVDPTPVLARGQALLSDADCQGLRRELATIAAGLAPR